MGSTTLSPLSGGAFLSTDWGTFHLESWGHRDHNQPEPLQERVFMRMTKSAHLLTSHDTEVPTRATAPVAAAQGRGGTWTSTGRQRGSLESAYPTEGPHSLLGTSGTGQQEVMEQLPTVPSSSQHTEDEDGMGCLCCKACQVGLQTTPQPIPVAGTMQLGFCCASLYWLSWGACPATHSGHFPFSCHVFSYPSAPSAPAFKESSPGDRDGRGACGDARFPPASF